MSPRQPDGFLAVPFGESEAGVLVLHAWWGLNDNLKSFCSRLAEHAFTAFAPDLYHGNVADTIPGAEALGAAMDRRAEEAKAEILAAAEFLQERLGKTGHSLAVIGFSLGAYYALDLSCAAPGLIRACVVFYGTGPADFSHSQASYLGHFAGNDPYEPKENVDALEAALQAAGRPVRFHRYPGTGHWFFEPDRAEAYDAPAASLAWERTLAFLRSAVEE